jgi:hypothetical protein
MAKIVKNTVTGSLGFVLVVHEDGLAEVVSWDRWPTDNLVLVAEIDDIVIPPPTPTAQQRIIAQAVTAIKKFKEEGRL